MDPFGLALSASRRTPSPPQPLAVGAGSRGTGESVIVDLRSPALVGLLGYWQSKRAKNKPLPARCDLDPIEMASDWLPLVALVDVEAETGRMRFRLVGTRFARDLGGEATGQYLDALTEKSEIAERLAELLTGVARHGRPERLSGNLADLRGRVTPFEALALPLSSDGTKVNMILAALVAKSVG